MIDTSRVFITGLGALTTNGPTLSQTWEAVLRAQSGIGPIENADLSTWSSTLVGELKDYQPAKMLPERKLVKVVSKQDVLGINAAMQAVDSSELINYRANLSPEQQALFNEKTAVFVGSPGNKYFQQDDFLPLLAKTGSDMQAFAKELFNEVHPMWLLRILPNNVLAYTGIHYGFKGPNHNITNHAVGGMQALIEAYQALKRGQAERAVVVAYDLLEPQALFYYEKLGVLSNLGLKPFDLNHNGTILADGAAALVLETEASLLARQGRALAEVKAGFSATEGAGLFSLEKEGAQLARLIDRSLAEAALSASELDLIVAHGNGNPPSDATEALALQQVCQEKPVPLTAFKWSVGHSITAAGLIDTALATLSLQEKVIPGVANLESKAYAHLDIEAKTRQLKPGKNSALIINRGFASMNAVVVIEGCD